MVLIKSLRYHNSLENVDIVVISDDLDNIPGCLIHKPDRLRFEQIPNRVFDIAAFYFLASFQLEYERLIWMGADQLILGDLSYLFYGDLPLISAPAEGNGIFRGHHEKICTGMLVVKPGPEMYEQVMEIAMEGVSYDGGDQGVINEWLIRQDIQPNIIPFEYDASIRHSAEAWWDVSEYKSIHFVGEKPWNSLERKGLYGLWWGWHDR